MSAGERQEAGQVGVRSPAGPRRVRLPRFVVAEPIGLGDVVKRITSWAGVMPCGGCERRARQLNDWVRLEPSRGDSDFAHQLGGRHE